MVLITTILILTSSSINMVFQPVKYGATTILRLNSI